MSEQQRITDLLRDLHGYIGSSIPQTISEHYRGCDLLDRIDAVLAGKLPDPAVTVTETIRTAPERIWLQVGDQEHYHSEQFPSDTSEVSWCADSVMTCEVPYVRADLAGKLSDHQEQHPDDAAVDRFATAMKEKLAAAREKGRGGWDDPEACSVELLADLLVGHVGKGNQGNFEDIANLAMMLHQRGAEPAVLAGKAPSLTSDRSLLDWAVTSWHEQVAHRPMENVYRRTLDSVWRQVIRFAGEDPHSIIGPSHDDLLYPDQVQEGGEPCASEPPSSSPA
ncbi:hypothetical protein ACB295_02460 [Aeromonas caviae]